MSVSWQNVVLRLIRKWHNRYSNTASKIHPSTPASMKGFSLPTLLTQVSESAHVRGETPLSFPGMCPVEGDLPLCAAALSREGGQAAQHTWEWEAKPAVAMLWVHTKLRTQPQKAQGHFACPQRFCAFWSSIYNNSITSVWGKLDKLHNVSVPHSRSHFSIRSV